VKKRPYRRTTPELVERVRQLAEAGISRSAIGKQVGRPESTIDAICYKYNISTRRWLGAKAAHRTYVVRPIDPAKAAKITEAKRRYWEAA
jgi:IS30 family transposase